MMRWLGKSTLGMTLALNSGFLRCISTDTVRQVLRSAAEQNPHWSDAEAFDALHRSSYEGCGDAVEQWQQCCDVVRPAIDALVHDALRRRISLVVEGVLLDPDHLQRDAISLWRAQGGCAMGVLLAVPDADQHRKALTERGHMKQLRFFDRIRLIQSELQWRARQHNWMLLAQQRQPQLRDDPVLAINAILDSQRSANDETDDCEEKTH
jgi:2-phosphoglycerate kinase